MIDYKEELNGLIELAEYYFDCQSNDGLGAFMTEINALKVRIDKENVQSCANCKHGHPVILCRKTNTELEIYYSPCNWERKE